MRLRLAMRRGRGMRRESRDAKRSEKHRGWRERGMVRKEVEKERCCLVGGEMLLGA
jgi:hypothetical protein